jgi:hypothetical protein
MLELPISNWIGFMSAFLSKLNISDWISLGSATSSLILAIASLVLASASLILAGVIGWFQIKQSSEMTAFEKRIDARDEKRHQEEIDAQTSKFISKYYRDRGLIPLCAIAAMHDAGFFYNRKMYNEFCWFPKELQNSILQRAGLNLRVEEFLDFYDTCIESLEKLLGVKFKNDKDKVYAFRQYTELALTTYGTRETSSFKDTLEDRAIRNEQALSSYIYTRIGAFLEKDKDASIHPLNDLFYDLGLDSTSDEAFCCFVLLLEAQYIAKSYNSDNRDSYGCPGAYDGERIESLEDQFLLMLFDIYIHLVLPEKALHRSTERN